MPGDCDCYRHLYLLRPLGPKVLDGRLGTRFPDDGLTRLPSDSNSNRKRAGHRRGLEQSHLNRVADAEHFPGSIADHRLHLLDEPIIVLAERRGGNEPVRAGFE